MSPTIVGRTTCIHPPGPRGFAAPLVMIGAIAALLSCGGDDTMPPPPVEPSRPTTIAIQPDTFRVTAGASVSLRSVVEDQRGKLVFNAPLTWVSSDPAVATVDTTGVVTGVREGSATVTVSTGSISATAAGTIRSQDHRTLIDIFNATDGGNWTNGTNWGGDEPIGTWYGVEANSDARVTALRLSDNGLSGQLPDDLGELAFLSELHVDGNEELSGPIPVSLSALELQQLQYGGTTLCTVRDEGFRAWLNAIPARDGDFIACIEERSDLMKLYDVMGGEDWENSGGWGTTAPLEDWYGIDVDSAGRVIGIDLDRNGLSGEVPPEIQYFARLRTLRLDYNDLEGEVPPEIGKLTELRRMDIDGNLFTGPIPPEFGNLVNIEELWMGGNDMSGAIPSELGNLVNLEDLGLYDAPFSGTIPEEFGRLANLRLLRIENTLVDGPIPGILGTLEKLRVLDVPGNRLSGSLPGELGAFDDLLVLDVRDNRITGPLPPELGQLGRLRVLRFSGNMIEGPLPAGLGQLDSLEWISAENNQLSGPLPPELGGSDGLVWLHLHNNPDLSGPLPVGLTSLRELRELIAYETGLCAPTEPEIRAWLNDVVTKWRIPACLAEAQAEVLLIQSTQSTEYPVPLVAGRGALLRVFVASETETAETIPPVRATFFVDGNEVHVLDIPAGSSSIPAEMQVGVLDLSANAEIPAEVIQPGLEMVVEVDPNATVDAALGVAKRIPAEGRMPVEVREVPPLHLTLVPFVSPDNNRDAVTLVSNATPDHEIFFETRTLLPVGVFEIRKHSSVRIDSNSIHEMLGELERIRAIEQGTGHWMGLNATAVGAGGVAYLGSNSRPGRGKISMSLLNSRIIAHELGHNLNLRHADCGGPSYIDLTFPYNVARTGVWGYDPRDGGSLVPPDRADIMSYCDPTWISDYYFTNALRFRLADTTEVQTSADTRTLLVSGGASADGALHLEPTFLVETLPIVPMVGGPYRLNRSARGRDRAVFGELRDAGGHGRRRALRLHPCASGAGRVGSGTGEPGADGAGRVGRDAAGKRTADGHHARPGNRRGARRSAESAAWRHGTGGA